MAKKKTLKNVRDATSSDKINFGANKVLTEKKWKARKNRDGTQSQFMEKTGVVENANGQKFKKRRVKTAIPGCSQDQDTQQRALRGDFDWWSRGERADRTGNREEYNKNFKQIKGFEKKKKTKQGLPVPKKFKKTYK